MLKLDVLFVKQDNCGPISYDGCSRVICELNCSSSGGSERDECCAVVKHVRSCSTVNYDGGLCWIFFRFDVLARWITYGIS